MKFMFIVKSGHAMPPTPELLEAMHTLADREIKAGRMLDNGGLMPLAMGAQVRIAGGQLSVIDGPFAEAKEVIGGYAVFELPGKEEAVASAVEFMQLHKEHLRIGRGPASCARLPPGVREPRSRGPPGHHGHYLCELTCRRAPPGAQDIGRRVGRGAGRENTNVSMNEAHECAQMSVFRERS